MRTRTLTWQDRCAKCGVMKATTKDRSFYAKAYMGPCGDSFCYPTCDSPSCKPIEAKVCDECEAALKA